MFIVALFLIAKSNSHVYQLVNGKTKNMIYIYIYTHTHTVPSHSIMSDSIISNSLQSHGLQPARLLWPWGFSRQEYWSGLPCPPPGDLPNPGIEPRSPPLWILYQLSYQGSPCIYKYTHTHTLIHIHTYVHRHTHTHTYIYAILLLLSCFLVVSDSVRPHRRQSTRPRHPWDSPGKNTGVGCHFLL